MGFKDKSDRMVNSYGIAQSKLPCIHMHLYETSGIQYFDDDIIIYIQGLCTRNLF
jgi:hypothetical protein